jgi:predicted ATPase
MAIKRIEIKNFKSFRHQKITLGQFNVLVGANASGKSNFLQIFKFISDIANHGLNNAISLQGGVEYLKNTQLAATEAFALKIVLDSTPEMAYEFSLHFDGAQFEIGQDKLTFVSEGNEFAVISVNGKVLVENTLGELLPEFFEKIRLIKTLKPQTLLIEQPIFRFALEEFFDDVDIFNNLFVYDFDVKQSKKAALMTGQLKLEEDSSNLAIVLKDILANKDKSRLFFNMLSYVLPFVEDVRVEAVADKYLILRLRETYSKVYLPTAFISDGTLNAISLIIALYFDETPLLLIEEPEKHIYPYLISAFIEMFKEISEDKQIIITTHESEMIKYADSENILLISRDNDGFSTICRPFEKEEVKIFLQNELRAEYLYTQDLLGISNAN